MPLILFSFSFNPETKEVAFTGNIEPELAYQILHQIIVAEGVKAALEQAKEKVKLDDNT